MRLSCISFFVANKKGGAWMGLKRSKMGVTGDSINMGSGFLQ
jgi:hypothetical protein